MGGKFLKFIIRHYFWTLVIVAALVVLIVFEIWSNSSKNYKNSVTILPVLQDYLTEAAAAKIMGDTIHDGRPIGGASYSKVSESAAKVAGEISVLPVPSKLKDYQRSALTWTNQIMAAAKNPGTWGNLPDTPSDFQLELNDSQSKAWLNNCLQNIVALKEFGDNAIANKDREAMRHVTAKLLVQQHWLKGIMYSQSVGFLSYLGTPVYAEYYPSSNEGGLYVPGFEAGCVEIPGGPRCPGSQTKKRAPTYKPSQPSKPAVKNPNNKPTAPGNTITKSKPNTPARTFRVVPIKNGVVLGQNYTYGTERAVCPGRSSCRPTAYEPAVEKTTGPAMDFIENKNGAEDAWKNSWKDFDDLVPAGEVGVPPSWPTLPPAPPGGPTIGVVQGEPILTQIVSPRVQLFFDQCHARGGIVAGGVVMSRLPNTESGYTCQYKYKSPTWGENPCWDLLTFSGGRYMGGNTGCPEWNLVPVMPAVVKKPAVKTTPPTIKKSVAPKPATTLTPVQPKLNTTPAVTTPPAANPVVPTLPTTPPTNNEGTNATYDNGSSQPTTPIAPTSVIPPSTPVKPNIGEADHPMPTPPTPIFPSWGH